MPVDKMGGGEGTGWNPILWKLQGPILRLQMHRDVSWLPLHADWGQMLEYIQL